MKTIRCYDCTGIVDCELIEGNGVNKVNNCPLCGSTQITIEPAANDCEEEDNDE